MKNVGDHAWCFILYNVFICYPTEKSIGFYFLFIHAHINYIYIFYTYTILVFGNFETIKREYLHVL